MLLQHPPPLGIDMEAPSPHPYGILAQGLSLTMRPIRTASPHWKFFPLSPEILLSFGSRANFLNFQNFGQIYTQGNRQLFKSPFAPFLVRLRPRTTHFQEVWNVIPLSSPHPQPEQAAMRERRLNSQRPVSLSLLPVQDRGRDEDLRDRWHFTLISNYAVVVWGFFRTRGKTTPAHSKVSSVLVVALYS